MLTKTLVVDVSSVLYLVAQQRLELLLKQNTVELFIGDELAVFLRSISYVIPSSIQILELDGLEIRKVIEMQRDYPQLSWVNLQSCFLARKLSCPILIEGNPMLLPCQSLGVTPCEIRQFLREV